MSRRRIEMQSPPKMPPQQQSTVDAWEGDIREMLERNDAPTAIYDCLRLTYEDFTNSLSAKQPGEGRRFQGSRCPSRDRSGTVSSGQFSIVITNHRQETCFGG